MKAGALCPGLLYPDKYLATSDRLFLWSFSKGEKFDSPVQPEFIQKLYADSQKPMSARQLLGIDDLVQTGRNLCP